MKFYLSNRLGNISNINTTTVRWVDIKDVYFLKTQEVKFIVENDDDVEYIKNVLSFSYKDIVNNPLFTISNEKVSLDDDDAYYVVGLPREPGNLRNYALLIEKCVY